ncbi:MAG: SLBB domain-containing protein [Filimonas sp.]|nr:SLBB domain-containing protein [Filimonas sp.]
MRTARLMTILFTLVLAIVSTSGFSQDLLRRNDLSQIRVDQLSDADISKLRQQLQSSGLTIDQAEQIALSKGMSSAEIAKLKQRLAGGSVTSTQRSQPINDTVGGKSRSDIYAAGDSAKARAIVINPKIFGSELFNNVSFNPKAGENVATPFNYVLGINDALEISVYGIQETDFNVTVSKEGSVAIPNVGQIRVVGLTIEDATARIRQSMSNTAYSTIRSGGSKLAVSLGNVRGIHVTVIGSNMPGNYTLSSLTTAFSALYVAGGPGPFGSFREIELIRDNKVERKIDLYRFLTNGDQSDNVRLKDNDVIRIPAYKTRVELTGQVKRPGIFEVLPGETFNNVLTFASGFTDTAYRASVHVTQFNDKEQQVKDIDASEFASYKPFAGDVFEIGKTLKRFANRVHITGAIFRPGYFELREGMTLSDLIKKADGIREDAFKNRAQVIRTKDDLTKEVISFNVSDAINNTGTGNVKLKKDDEVIISSIFDLRDEYKVSIQGEVRSPGDYAFADNLTIRDLIIQAGGLTEAAYPQRIEIARVLRRDTLTAEDARASEVIEIRNEQDLSTPTKNLDLKPFDVVTVRRKPGANQLESVVISGQVQYPGPYVISTRSERVSDVIKRAGSFTPEAYIEGAYLKRYLSAEELQLKKDKLEKLQRNTKDTTNQVMEDLAKSYDQVPLDIPSILSHPGSSQDLVLKLGDEIYVPKFDASVKVSGGVLLPTQIPYERNYSVKDYLSAAGGVADNAQKKRIYVLYANGRAKATKHFLFFKNYPEVKPGAEVVVPRKPERRGLSTGETIGIASALASLAGVVIAIINMTK